MNRSLLVAGLLTLSLDMERVARAEEPSSQNVANTGRAPTSAWWTGVRAGVFSPYGALYTDANLMTTPMQDFATAGPSLELDVGGRFARQFVGYAAFDLARLGRGNSAAWTTPHGGQSAPSTLAVGVGLRWETNPDGLGLAADVGIGYRWFTARWGDQTTVQMGAPAEVRVGVGASWRITQQLTLDPMLTAFSGVLTNRTLNGQELGQSSNSYTALGLTLGGHFDLD